MRACPWDAAIGILLGGPGLLEQRGRLHYEVNYIHPWLKDMIVEVKGAAPTEAVLTVLFVAAAGAARPCKRRLAWLSRPCRQAVALSRAARRNRV